MTSPSSAARRTCGDGLGPTEWCRRLCPWRRSSMTVSVSSVRRRSAAADGGHGDGRVGAARSFLAAEPQWCRGACPQRRFLKDGRVVEVGVPQWSRGSYPRRRPWHGPRGNGRPGAAERICGDFRYALLAVVPATPPQWCRRSPCGNGNWPAIACSWPVMPQWRRGSYPRRPDITPGTYTVHEAPQWCRRSRLRRRPSALMTRPAAFAPQWCRRPVPTE